MQSSKPATSRTHACFSSVLAVPTTRAAPIARAIWPASEPVAPAAAVTSTVSPAAGRPISRIPTHAVTPVVPSTPRASLGSPMSGGKSSNGAPSRGARVAYSCQPRLPSTRSPAANPGCADVTTWPTPVARMTSPMATGGTYDGTSLR